MTKNSARAKDFNYLMGTGVLSPSSGVHQGAQVFNNPLTVGLLGRPTSPKIFRPACLALGLLIAGLAMLFSGLFFAHSAYAVTPYLNVSSGAPGGLISFNKVQPSSAGEMATASDTLTINTNCTVGYNVYISAVNGGETSLVNNSVSAVAAGNNTISASSAAMGGTSAALTADTWGVNYVDDGTYFGLPAYEHAIDNPLAVKSSVGTTSTVPIYYGAKVSTALAPGSYNGDVLYTVLPNNACTYYTVHYNANGGTGTMNDQDIIVGETTALSRNTFTRSGYTFLGWSNSANGKTGTAVNGVGTAADVDYPDTEKVTDIADFNTTKQLYAIWALVTGDMQTWTGCSALATNSIVYLRDTRDSKVYAIKKLADGKCWMMNNLSVSNVVMTSSDTNLASGATFDLTSVSQSGSSGWCAIYSADCDDQKSVYAREDSNGYLYNWYTATAGNGTYSTAANVTINYDICPKGWHLPVGGDNATSNQFALLDIALGGTGTNRMSANTYSAMTDIFPLAGYISTSLYDVGMYGFYWSSTAQSNSNAYSLSLNSDDQIVGPRDNYGKCLGFSVRCLAQKRYTVNYNVNGASGSPSKTTDGTQYENASVTTATVGSMTKTGYHFLGWSTSSSASSAAYSAGSSQTVSTMASAAGTADGGTITLYAIWAPNTFTISYSANGGSGSPSGGTTSAQYGTNITMPAKGTLTRSGYDFQGWSLSSTATSATWPASQSGIAPTTVKSNVTTVNGGSVTVYAVWKSSGPSPCSSSNPISATNGCTLADGKAWIYGNSGNTLTWNTLCTSSDNCKSSTYCPSGYSVPTYSILSTLVGKYSGAGLYNALNGTWGSSYRSFWSSTLLDSYYAYRMYVYSSRAGTSNDVKTGSFYLLCYKSV